MKNKWRVYFSECWWEDVEADLVEYIGKGAFFSDKVAGARNPYPGPNTVYVVFECVAIKRISE